MIDFLPHINASLNLVATVLLVTGYLLIRSQKETAHKRAMLAAFLVSCLFLVCYLIYHANAGSKKFPSADYAAFFYILYLLILIPHIILAATVPVLGITTIWLGLSIDRLGKRSDESGKIAEKEQKVRSRHRKWARFTFPIWLFVSITGVLVYLFLYWWFPPISELVQQAGP